jgi:hypothetical protein
VQGEPRFGLAVSEAYPGCGHDQKPAEAWQRSGGKHRESRRSLDFLYDLLEKLLHTNRNDSVRHRGCLRGQR